MADAVDERGLTLIELTVVLLVIAILFAISIPLFLGASSSADDRAAQSNLSSALTEVRTMFVPNQSYAVTYLAAATLTSSAPEIHLGARKGVHLSFAAELHKRVPRGRCQP